MSVVASSCLALGRRQHCMRGRSDQIDEMPDTDMLAEAAIPPMESYSLPRKLRSAVETCILKERPQARGADPRSVEQT
jgi:hypothetical protein